MAEEQDSFTYPYISYATFKNFLLSLDAAALPPRIDRSLMVGMAGGTQTHLLQALRSFTLIGEGNQVQEPFIRMAGNEVAFADAMRAILRHFYAPQMELAEQQATTAQLMESFALSGYTGSTLRKAMTFFLHAAKDSGLPLSPHFRPPAATASGRPRRTSKAKAKPAAEPVQATPTPAAESHSIRLRSGGLVTLSCTTEFLALSRADRDFLFGLVDALRDYEEATTADAVVNDKKDDGGNDATTEGGNL
jgi:hypothetical protein